MLVWTRMGGESGETLNAIMIRKEKERLLSDGLFFWGVGNPPSRLIPYLAERNSSIPVTFSKMRSQAKKIDTHPTSIYLWRRYVDHQGRVKCLPQASLVTSRSSGATPTKHYALVCESLDVIALKNYGPFDPTAYINAGGRNRSVGSSQVTALLRKVGVERHDCGYEINMKAHLVKSIWVKLVDPVEIPRKIFDTAVPMLSDVHIQPSEWLGIVTTMKCWGQENRCAGRTGQLAMFDCV